MEKASDDLSELYRISRGMFQWYQMPFGEPPGHDHDEQRSQRSSNTSRHSGNTEKAPVTSPQVFPGQRSSVEDDEPTIPHEAKGSSKQTLRYTKGNRRPGTLNSTSNVRTWQNRFSRRRVARTFVHATYGDIRLIQILFVQAFQIYKLIGHRRSDARGSDPSGGDWHGLKEALEPLGRTSRRRAVSLFGPLGSTTLSSSRIKPSLGAVRNDVKDPPNLESGQGIFGHSPMRGGRIIRDLFGVSIGLPVLPRPILGIVRKYISV
ncbi:hypothetical protein CRG98_018760 [Punica granatum]|uniref:Uncharacterized protein n=1 Tax=Punica granatum TaxID=22663 RepID=A0A2I0JX65_PUNGR|nr:hypothetical protein CRG98_018760 [Punica granatum]